MCVCVACLHTFALIEIPIVLSSSSSSWLIRCSWSSSKELWKRSKSHLHHIHTHRHDQLSSTISLSLSLLFLSLCVTVAATPVEATLLFLFSTPLQERETIACVCVCVCVWPLLYKSETERRLMNKGWFQHCTLQQTALHTFFYYSVDSS